MEKKEIRNSLFQVLEGGLVHNKPVTRFQTALAQFYFGLKYYGSQSDQYSIPAKSGCG